MEFVWDEKVDEIFWKFIYERHSIWHRRFVEQRPAPWTNDPILLKNKFTNIYRELDPGTEFARSRILEADAPNPDKVFNIMLYRLMISIPTYGKIGFQYLDSFDWEKFQDQLRQIYLSGEPVFGNAYLISPYSSMGSALKYENVARLFRNVHRDIDRIWGALGQCPSLEWAYKTINSVYGFGPFLAYQVCVDLMYPNRNTGEKILPFTHDDWARLGPGALRGLSRLTQYYGDRDALEALRYLWSHQHEKFGSEYGLDFPYLRDEYNQEIAISLSNMQNSLCEFHKYGSIWEGSGKAQRLFVPAERR